MAERLTEEVLQELLESSSLDSFVDQAEFSSCTLAEYLQRLLEKKHLKRSRVVRMADLNETFGYQIFTGTRNPSRDKVLQIAFAMALTLRETNRALVSAGVSTLDPKCRRDAIVIFCVDHGCSLQKVNEELYRLGEETIC
ncbi:helix-turn-helix transcriptional regulator [Collinsella provencensis]|uniref:helix-turn-helix transcriptional regulator n=1 Tax=Collinsella provencensis TaxID=1937461 RepID=UPI000C85E5E5|nr:helix-turn-helix transcriptional regulator [Collinsella provencensis]